MWLCCCGNSDSDGDEHIRQKKKKKRRVPAPKAVRVDYGDDEEAARAKEDEVKPLTLQDVLETPLPKPDGADVHVDSGLEFVLKARPALTAGDVVAVCEYVSTNLGPGFIVVPAARDVYKQGGLVIAEFGAGNSCSTQRPFVVPAPGEERIFAEKAVGFTFDADDCDLLWPRPMFDETTTHADVLAAWREIAPERQIVRPVFGGEHLRLRISLHSNAVAPPWTRREVSVLRNGLLLRNFVCSGRMVSETKLKGA